MRYRLSVEQGPLSALETVRRDAVVVAQRRLAEVCEELSEHEARLAEASAVRLRCAAARLAQRAQFSEAGSVQRLRLTEGALRGLTHALSLSDARLATAEQAVHRARAKVREAEQGLLNAEVSRRAISTLLSTRRVVAEKRRERDEEDQAEDVFRSRHRD